MTDLDTRIQEAFNAVSMPPELKAQTLHFIKSRQGFENPAVEIRPAQAFRHTAIKRPTLFTRRFGLAFAACLLLCALGFGGFKAYTTETAFIDIDVNPSLSIGVNIFDIVVSAKPLNEDGAQVLSQMDLVGKGYNDAMDTLLESDALLAYIENDSLVGVSIISDVERQSATLATECEQKLAKLPCKSVCGQATHEEHEAALDEGMGVSRYRAALELMRLDPAVTMDECRSMPLRELRSRIAALDPDNAYAAQGSEHGQGARNGPGVGKNNESGSDGKDAEATTEHEGNGMGAGQGNGSGRMNGNGFEHSG